MAGLGKTKAMKHNSLLAIFPSTNRSLNVPDLQIERELKSPGEHRSLVVALGVIGGTLFELIADSTYATRQGDAREQPIPFSHAHHVGSMGIDCRYCHTSVENSDLGVVPPTKTCMNCHSQIWINSSDFGAGARELPDQRFDPLDEGV